MMLAVCVAPVFAMRQELIVREVMSVTLPPVVTLSAATPAVMALAE